MIRAPLVFEFALLSACSVSVVVCLRSFLSPPPSVLIFDFVCLFWCKTGKTQERGSIIRKQNVFREFRQVTNIRGSVIDDGTNICRGRP